MALKVGQISKSDSENIFTSYINTIKKTPLLTAEEERELAEKYRAGDKLAENRLIEANLRLVVKIARAYNVKDVPFMDLVQEGNIGLMKAVEKYETEKNVRFSTYASWWIRQAIGRYLTNKRRAIRMPNRKEDYLRAIQLVYHGLCQSLKRLPRPEEIAREVGIPTEEVEMILGFSGSVISLDSTVSDENRTAVIDTQEDYRYCPVKALLRNSSRNETLRFLNMLKGKERNIIMYRYQFIPNAPKTFKKIGEHLGISAEAVRQIEMRALKKIRAKSSELRECVYA